MLMSAMVLQRGIGPVCWSNNPGQRRILVQSVHYYLYLHHISYLPLPISISLLHIVTSLLQNFITIIISSLLQIITRSMMGNNSFIITRYLPGQLGDAPFSHNVSVPIFIEKAIQAQIIQKGNFNVFKQGPDPYSGCPCRLFPKRYFKKCGDRLPSTTLVHLSRPSGREWRYVLSHFRNIIYGANTRKHSEVMRDRKSVV